MMPPRLGSLFSGIGMLDRAVETVLGCECWWQVERDVYCREILRERWPGLDDVFDDIAQLEPRELVRVDVLAGGVPCQDVSDAGPRLGVRDGARSGLWRHMLRLCEALQPELVILENVRGLRRRGLDVIVADLMCAGYDVAWTSNRALDVGAPHRRERVFLLATRRRDRIHRWARQVCDAGELLAHRFPPGRFDAEGWARWPGARPGLYRRPHGLPAWIDRPWLAEALRQARLRALGNSVCPQQAIFALVELLALFGGCYDHSVSSWRARLDERKRWTIQGTTRGRGWPAAGIATAALGVATERIIPRAPLVASWPTPTANDYGSSQNGICSTKPSGGTPSLSTIVRHGLWATACTTDAAGSARRSTKRGRTHTGNTLTDQIREMMPARGRELLVLNPDFVEGLMGTPEHWTIPSSPHDYAALVGALRAAMLERSRRDRSEPEGTQLELGA